MSMRIKRKRARVMGNVVSFNYDFGMKVAGSVAECPLKIYRGQIDPANPPAPGDAAWVEETRQSVLDKLKSQNELLITSTNISGRTAVYNGQTYVTQDSAHPALRDDLAGKVSGSVTENPHIVKYIVASSLTTPNGFSSEPPTTDGWRSYDNIKVQGDSKTSALTASSSGVIPQFLLAFNVVEAYKRKFGYIPADGTLAGEIAWLKNNINSAIGNVYAYGNCPTGNIAYLRVFYKTDNSWHAVQSNTSNSPTALQIVNTDSFSANVLQDDGFVYFLVCTDAARTTDNSMLVMTSHGLVVNDLIENTSRSNAAAIVGLSFANNISLSAAVFSGISTSISGQTSGDVIKKYRKNTTWSPVAETGTTTTTLKITNHGLSTGDYIANATRGWAYTKVTVVDANTLTCQTAITGQTTSDSIRLFAYFGTQTAEATVISSTIYLDYANIELQVASEAGYDTLVPPNPRRDAVTTPYDTILSLAKVYADETHDFTGKVAGSVTENPNIAKQNGNASLLNPSSFTSEFASGNGYNGYDNIKSQNGVCSYRSDTTNGVIPQQLFAFNIIADVEKIIGTIPLTITGVPATDLANKIQWIKDNISLITCDWYGFGSCPIGYEAWITAWAASGTYWAETDSSRKTTSSTVAHLKAFQGGNDIKNYPIIQSDGFVYFLAYTDASNGTVASQINTDYVKLTIQFKQPTSAIELMTQNSVDVDVQVANKAEAYLAEVDLTPVCNGLYGGSNAAMKAAASAIYTNAMAMGSGALNAALTNKVSLKMWGVDATAYTVDLMANTTGNIASINYTTFVPTTKITSANKFYALIQSAYASDGTIPSSVSLDFISVRVDFSRTADNVPNCLVNWTGNGEIYINGFSPAWTETTTKIRTLALLRKDDNNYIELYYDYTTKKFNMKKVVNGTVITISSSVQIFSKNQVFNILLQQTSTGMEMHIQKNNSTREKITNTDTNQFTGICTLYALGSNVSGKEADGTFIEVSVGNYTIADADADILVKTAQELLNTAQSTTQTVKVLPNNRYQLKTTKFITITEKYNNITLKTTTVSADTIFTTQSNTNCIQLDTTGDFSALSLKLYM